MLKLYHGSNIVIEKPDLQLCKPYKDFGKGFYLSADKKQAEMMAEQRVRQIMEGEPVVNEFEFDESLLTSEELKVLTFEGYCEDWAKFILANRNIHNEHPIHDYDIVYGPIADDSVSFQLRRYQRGVINTIQELIHELEYSKGITFQYYFGTQKALDKLIRL